MSLRYFRKQASTVMFREYLFNKGDIFNIYPQNRIRFYFSFKSLFMKFVGFGFCSERGQMSVTRNQKYLTLTSIAEQE